MAEGIRAVITADSKPFIAGVNAASASAKQFQTAIAGATAGSLKFTPALNQAVPSITKFSNQIPKASKNFKLMKGSMQQVGFQVQDFAVQVAGGTSAVTAFGQQGSQLAGIFGPGGAVIGAVIAVGSALAGIILKMGGAAKSTAELSQEVTELGQALMTINLLALNDRLSDQAEITDKLSSKIRKVNDELEVQKDLIGIGSATEEQARIARIGFLQKEQKSLNSQLRSEEAILRRIGAEQTKLVKAGQPAGVGSEVKDIAKIEKQALDDSTKALDEALRVRAALTNQFTTSEIERLQLKHDTQREMIAAALAAQQITEQEARDFKTTAEQIHADGIDAIWNKSVNDRARVEEQAQSRIQALRQSVASNAAGLLSVLGRKNKLAAVAAIALTKGLAIAQTLAHTQTAAMLAYSSQLVPGDPTSPARAAAAYTHTQTLGKLSAGLIAATGLAEAFSGGGGGGGAAAGGVASNTGGAGGQAQQQQNQVVNINLEGEVFGREQVRGLIGQINEALDDGFTLNLG